MIIELFASLQETVDKKHEAKPVRKSHVGTIKSSGLPAAVKARAEKYNEQVANRGHVATSAPVG